MKALQKFALKDFTLAIELLLRNGNAKSVTVFCSPLANVRQRVRVSRGNDCRNSLVVTYGRLNFREREYLAQCKRAGVKIMRKWRLW